MEETTSTTTTHSEQGSQVDEAQSEFGNLPEQAMQVLDLADAAFMKGHRQMKTVLEDHINAADRILLQQQVLVELEKQRIENLERLLKLRSQENQDDNSV